MLRPMRYLLVIVLYSNLVGREALWLVDINIITAICYTILECTTFGYLGEGCGFSDDGNDRLIIG